MKERKALDANGPGILELPGEWVCKEHEPPCSFKLICSERGLRKDAKREDAVNHDALQRTLRTDRLFVKKGSLKGIYKHKSFKIGSGSFERKDDDKHKTL